VSILNVEIKAKSNNQAEIREILQAKEAIFKGIDSQKDTYFRVLHGRLKLREGNIENNLIHYVRPNQAGPKQSEITLFKSNPDSTLKSILSKSNGVLTVVEKKREIYFIENVKIHLDSVEGLGTFVEIEAIDRDGSIGEEKLLVQCEYYLKLFGIDRNSLISNSYSDLMLDKQ